MLLIIMSLMLPVWSGQIPQQLIILERYLRGWISLVMPWMIIVWRTTNNQLIPNQRNTKICKSDTAIDRDIQMLSVNYTNKYFWNCLIWTQRNTYIFTSDICISRNLCFWGLIQNKWHPFHWCRTMKSTLNIWVSLFFSHIISWILSSSKL